MRLTDELLHLSATDLASGQSCGHLSALERAAARGTINRPHRQDPTIELLRERGRLHEAAYVDTLRAEGLDVTDLREHEGETLEARTRAAMRAGADVIVQGALSAGRWGGRLDVLRRVDEPQSDLGAWSYEVVDTKLALETRGGTVLQLCLYNELVAGVQGTVPGRMWVVKPGPDGPLPEEFRTRDFAAYYRRAKAALERWVDADEDAYPDPVAHCQICRWWEGCDRRRREDDHLSLVADLQTLHRVELTEHGVETLEQLGRLERPPDRPSRGHPETYARLREQAKVQLRGRNENRSVHEMLPIGPERGLCRLPEPCPDDLHLDLEKDAFVPGGGLEYLFGWCTRDGDTWRYEKHWALDRAEERRAFERCVDALIERTRANPAANVYHFSPYEPAALKRLMGRYATREAEVDELLRGGRFVDLHAIVRQSLRASVEQYTLKNLEAFTGFDRDADLRESSHARRRIGAALELSAGREAITPDDRELVERYNRDDCLSTVALQEWLERLRTEEVARGATIDRPPPQEGEASEKVEERRAEVQAVFDDLLAGLPEDPEQDDEPEHAGRLLAHLLDYFRREEKVATWERYRLLELEREAFARESKALAGLTYLERTEEGRAPVDRYRYEPQEFSFRKGAALYAPGGEKIGTAAAIDVAHATLDIKKMVKTAERHPRDVYAIEQVPTAALDRSLLAFARSVAEHGIDGNGPHRAGRDLLLRRPPVETEGAPLLQPGERTLDAAIRLCEGLDGRVLAMQGPPGSGKTYVGSHVIAKLHARGKRIGVTAVSHKVIRNLLNKAVEADPSVRAVQKVGKATTDDDVTGVMEVDTNPAAADAIATGAVVGGTAWLWARDEIEETLDYLFVDEAGQLSLAVLLSMARSTRNLVLLGDPQQLEQPQQASHPEGTDTSALEHLLAGRATIPAWLGLFLEQTWRLHPSICKLTSKLHYDDRLGAAAGCEQQAILGAEPLGPDGLFLLPVTHNGNQQRSDEEVRAIASLVERLTAPGVRWRDIKGKERPMTLADILIVAPYNAQVAALAARLPEAKIGTVDRFQGQEAPVVLYSMTASTALDAPRGIGFLFNPNRFNVATSRARAMVVLVVSPALLEAECRSPEEMRQANGLCTFAELATTIEPEGALR